MLTNFKFIYKYSRLSFILDKFHKIRYKFSFMEDFKKDLLDRFTLSSTLHRRPSTLCTSTLHYINITLSSTLHSSTQNVISIQTTTLNIKVFLTKRRYSKNFRILVDMTFNANFDLETIT